MSGNSTAANYDWLHESPADKAGRQTHVVTASRRLARELRAAFADHEISQGRSAWRTPAIWYWHDWLTRLAVASSDPVGAPRRLSSLSASVLWERCLREQLPGGLLSLAGIVHQAVQAWQRLNDWEVPLAELAAAARNQDEQHFATAALAYQQRLNEASWVDAAGMAGHVAHLIDAGVTARPDRLVLAGFDRLTPAAKRVMSSLEAAGCTVDRIEASAETGDISVAPFEDEAAELRAAGAWARAMLEANPEAKIAIVCPALEADAAGIARLVREGLAPGWQYGGNHYHAAANVSYGRRLSEFPAIAVALLILGWTSHGLTSRQLGVLLRSRCLASDKLSGRSRLERRLRRLPDRDWTARNALEALASGDDSAESRAFLACVREVAELAESDDAGYSPADCVVQIDALLNKVRWPGDAPLDSSEFQLLNRWRELLNELARIDAVVPRIRRARAIQLLTSLAQETLWQPEDGQGLVQVLGTLEAAGMAFDAVWISGLDAAQWPPPARPLPFISHALQRKYQMPDATPSDTLEFARRVLGRLIGAADRCVLSWSRMRGDAELTASPLLDAVDAHEYAGPGDPGWHAAAPAARTAAIERRDDEAPPVAADEHVGGGAYTVQRQFSEPFGAFVHGRLGVRPPEFISHGLAPSVRGSIIHNALHNLLSGRPTRADLSRWTAAERDRRIGSAIDAALAEHTLHADAVIRRIIALERRRLRRIMRDFLDAEALRREFFVADVEKRVDYDAFGVRLGLRIDRIDRLADGRLLVIDYKTGVPKHFLNKDGDPTDLQLIVYADALDDDIGGLVLINVDSREISYRGAGGGWLDADEVDWPATLRAWRHEVHAAVRALAAGDVRINLRQTVGEGRPLNILSRLEEQKRAD